MIKIVKNNVEKYVTKGSYENLYKKLGFEMVPDKSVKKETAPVNEAVSNETDVKVNTNSKKNEKHVQNK